MLLERLPQGDRAVPFLLVAGLSAEVLQSAGGLGAAALGFGARTIVENGLSGLELYLNRPFVVERYDPA